MDNVISLVPSESKNLPNESAIELAENLLQWCKEGRIQMFVVVGVAADGTIIDGWSNNEEINPYIVLGGLEKCKIEYSDINLPGRDDREEF
jgi:hypothetical protein